MIITITGDIGSGKSTVARKLAKMRNYGYFSTGDTFREYAMERGLSVLELSELAKTSRSIDDYLDGLLTHFDRDDYVIDSRMAWYFVAKSYKVYLKVSAQTAARRIMNDGRASERYTSEEEALASILSRKMQEEERYRRLYGVAIDNLGNYDLVLDTSAITTDEAVAAILSAADRVDSGL